MYNGMYYCDSVSQDGFPGASTLVQPSQALSFFPMNASQGCANAPLQAAPQPPLFAVSPQPPVVPAARPSSPGTASPATAAPRPVVWAPNGVYGMPQLVGSPAEGAPFFLAQKDSGAAAASNPQPVYVMPQSTIPWGPVVYMVPSAPVQQEQQQQQNAYACAQPPQHARTEDAVTPEPRFVSDENTIQMPSSQANLPQLSAANIENMAGVNEAGKKNKVNINVVCRHFMKSCCNRRKCRFLHATESSLLSQINLPTSNSPGASPEDVVAISSNASSIFGHENGEKVFLRMEELMS